MVEEFGVDLVFKDADKNVDYRLVEVGNRAILRNYGEASSKSF
jgi:hypothetical protein